MDTAEKLIKANNNILNLVDEVIELKKEKGTEYCCYFNVEDYKGCSGHCVNCKEIYYNKLHDNMIIQYTI